MPEVKKKPEVYKYLPDWIEGKKGPPREYFWQILKAKANVYYKNLV